MSDAMPAWLEWVKAPLLLAAPDGATIVALNAAARRLFGGLVLPAPPCPLALLIGPEAAHELGSVPRLCEAAAPVNLMARIAGKPRTIALEVSPVEEPAGHFLLTVQDRVTESEAGTYISTIYEDVQAVLEWLPVGIELFDASGDCVFINSHGARLFGWGKDELNVLDDWWVHAYPDPEYRALVIRAWNEAIATSRAEGSAVPLADWKVTCKDGSTKLVQSRFRCIGDHQVLVYWDVSEERRMQAELRHHAGTDELTGLRNRRSFSDDAAVLLEAAAAAGRPVSALMIDIDHFKAINDRHGHAVGDAVLRELAGKCRRTLRESDIVARLGGEEFVALIPEGELAAAQIAEDLRHFIEVSPVELGGLRMRLTTSIGVATSERPPHDIDVLLARADHALYAAKHGGRNRVVAESGILRSAAG